ncbi:MAG: 2-hydroxychromene-2-carboxylate isomerase, partial [Burkholderiales bacterium]
IMPRTVDFYFDYGSPTSYLAYTQMPGLAQRTGATVNYLPILLGGVFQATGNRSPVDVAAKGKWMQQDLRHFADRYRVPFRWNSHFPINTLPLMRGAAYALREGFLIPYSDAVYKALWSDGLNMGDPAVIGNVLKEAGLDAPKIMAATQEQAVKDALKSATEQAVKRGLFGAPTFFVGERMHFGQDRLPYVEECLRG